MKKYLKYIICFIFCLVMVGLRGNVMANPGGTDEMAYMLLDLVKDARANARQALVSNGNNVEVLLSCRPGLKDYIDEGFPKIIPDARLFSSARAHAADMADQDYFSKISKTGLTIDERFLQTGFYSILSDEIVSVVLFQNYMPKEKAVGILWKGMLDNEVDCKKQPEPILFNPDFREIGISVQSGTMKLNGLTVNFYVAVCDFGNDTVSSDEKEVFFQMNKARAIPETLIRYLDPETDYIGTGLPPYRFNMLLYAVAKKTSENRILEITQNAGFENILPLPERILNEGYNALSATEISRVWITVDKKTPLEIRDYFLKELFSYEIGLPDPAERILLNPEGRDAGMALITQPFVSEGKEYFIHAVAMVAANPLEPGDTFVLSGHLELENDNDDFQGVLLQAKTEDEQELNFFTDRSGAFSVELVPGNYKIGTSGNETNIMVPVFDFTMPGQNTYIVLKGIFH